MLKDVGRSGLVELVESSSVDIASWSSQPLKEFSSSTLKTSNMFEPERYCFAIMIDRVRKMVMLVLLDGEMMSFSLNDLTFRISSRGFGGVGFVKRDNALLNLNVKVHSGIVQDEGG